MRRLHQVQNRSPRNDLSCSCCSFTLALLFSLLSLSLSLSLSISLSLSLSLSPFQFLWPTLQSEGRPPKHSQRATNLLARAPVLLDKPKRDTKRLLGGRRTCLNHECRQRARHLNPDQVRSSRTQLREKGELPTQLQLLAHIIVSLQELSNFDRFVCMATTIRSKVLTTQRGGEREESELA